MAIIIFLLIIIALAAAPEAIINFCRLLDFILVAILKFGIFIFVIGFWTYLLWGRM